MPAQPDPPRYVATMKIEKIERTIRDAGVPSRDAGISSRAKTIIATVHIASSSLGSLTRKVSAHLALIEDGGDIGES